MRELLFKILRYSGLPFIFRELIQRNKVSIILYHDINKEAASQSFIYLSKKYNIIGLADFLEACKNGTTLPKKALIITFDDGHIRNYELLPVIKKLNIPVTIFLCAGIINTNRHYWFTFKSPEISKDDLKKISNQEKLKKLLKAGFHVEKEFEQAQALSKAQINKMKEFVDFQSHTVFHPCLPTCNNTEAREEILRSRQILEEDYDLNINAIAYPNGDYSDRCIQLVKEAGYNCALTVDFGFNTTQTDLFRLKRLSVNDTDSLDELIVKTSGVWWGIMILLGKYRRSGWSKPVVEKESLSEVIA